MAKKIHKKWKRGDIALVSWQNLNGEPGEGYARCVVVKVQKEKRPEPGKSLCTIFVRDPNGHEWQCPDWVRKGARGEDDEEVNVGRIVHADYSKMLAGKIIRWVRWSNAPDDNFRDLNISFIDDTHVSFRFRLDMIEIVELADFKGGKFSNERRLRPLPVKKPEE